MCLVGRFRLVLFSAGSKNKRSWRQTPNTSKNSFLMISHMRRSEEISLFVPLCFAFTRSLRLMLEEMGFVICFDNAMLITSYCQVCLQLPLPSTHTGFHAFCEIMFFRFLESRTFQRFNPLTAGCQYIYVYIYIQRERYVCVCIYVCMHDICSYIGIYIIYHVCYARWVY